MSDALAGTPPPTTERSGDAQTSTGGADGSGLNAQQQKEYLTLKQKAEEFNKVKADLEAKERELAQLKANAGGGTTATDQTPGFIQQLRESAGMGDVASQAALLNIYENWLNESTASVPESKRAQVKALIRNSGYQMSPDYALTLVTDPKAGELQKRVQELETENQQLKTAKPNGVSPAATGAASGSERSSEAMPWSEAKVILQGGGPRALELRKKMDARRQPIDYGR